VLGSLGLAKHVVQHVGEPLLIMHVCKRLTVSAHCNLQVGAGISLAPNGLRVLDTLGLAQQVVQHVGEPLHTMQALRPNEKTIVEFPTMAQEVRQCSSC
jgi:hypothetical protein